MKRWPLTYATRNECFLKHLENGGGMGGGGGERERERRNKRYIKNNSSYLPQKEQPASRKLYSPSWLETTEV